MIKMKQKSTAGFGRALRASQHRAEQYKAIAVWSGLVALVGGIVLARVMIGKPALDADLCPAGHVTAVHVMCVVDFSDPVSELQYAFIRDDIMKQAAALRAGERLTLLTLGPGAAGAVTSTLFSRCDPGRGSEASELTENRRLQSKLYDEQFRAPLEAAIASLPNIGPSKRSPILEGLHEALTRSDFAPATPLRVLRLYTDLLQHSELWSDYGGKRDRGRLQTSAYVADVQNRLVGAEVTVFRIPRRDVQPPADHLKFWQDYFAAAGAAVEIKTL